VATKLTLSLADITEITGESEPTIRRAMTAGDLPTFLVGRRRFANPDAVRRWVDFLEIESNSGRPVCYRSRSKDGRGQP
jgi:hypothetical protein